MRLNHYQNQPFPFELPGDDAITFIVLSGILKDTHNNIYTDGRNIMVCHSTSPFPVWAWCRDEEDDEAVAAIADCLKEHFPLEAGYRYNISYGLLDRLRQADDYFAGAKIGVNMLSYRLDALLPATHPCDGRMEAATMELLDELARYFQAATLEMEHMERPLEWCRKNIAEKIEGGLQFLWRNDAGEIVAITSYREMPPYGKIAGVYTLPEHRRRGYAMNLVHRVTARELEKGLTPILYTDADYGASNACYQKLGYAQIGSLCTVKK